MGIGMTIALVIVGVALFTGIGARPIATATGTGAPDGAATGHQGHDPADGATRGSATPTTLDPKTAANIRVSVKHLGDLQLLIEADVASRQSDAALIKADVVASTDMTEMPGSHYKGDIKLDDVEGRPGRYAAITKVPMVGQYDVRVRSNSPLKGEADKVVEIGTVSARGGVPSPTP
jgi:hypothetical protein